MPKIKSTLSKSLPAIIVSVMFTTAIIYAAWQEPTQEPPGGNVPAPINVGTKTQSKAGAFGVSGVFTTDNATFLAVIGSGVNIGATTTPQAKLEVMKDLMVSAWNPFFYLNGTWQSSPNRASIGIRSAGEVVMNSNRNNPNMVDWEIKYGSGTYPAFPNNDAFYISRKISPTSTPSYYMLINSSGNVGIGTATPSTKLEIAGQIKITGGNPGVGKVLTSDATGLASWQRIISGPQFFTSPGNFHTFLPAGTYYITAIGGGGGSGGAQAGGGTKDGGGGGGGAYVFAKCIFTNPLNELSIIVGKGGDYGTWGAAGLNGGTSSVLMNGNTIVSAEGGKGGKCRAGYTCTQDGSGGSSVSANNPCSIVASAPGGNGGPDASVAGSGGGGAGNGGLGGKSPMSGHDGSNGGTVNNSLVERYSIKGGNGGYGQCNQCTLVPSTQCSNINIRSPEQPQGFPGNSPGGGAGSSCNGAPGSNGGDGVVIIYPEL